jgi:hypothetical protein
MIHNQASSSPSARSITRRMSSLSSNRCWPTSTLKAVVTADALHTQRSHATFLVEKKADYVFTVKGNQPGTLAAVKGLFEQGYFPP